MAKMSLYAGLLDDASSSAASAAAAEWGGGPNMIAEQLRRKKAADKAAAAAASAASVASAAAAGASTSASAAAASTAAAATPAAVALMRPRIVKPAHAQHHATHGAAPSAVPGVVTTTVIAAATAATATPAAAALPAEPFVETERSQRHIENPYDPWRPNDYEDVKTRLAQKRATELEAERRRALDMEIDPDDPYYAVDHSGTAPPSKAAIAPPSSLTESTGPPRGISPQPPPPPPVVSAPPEPPAAPAISAGDLHVSGEEAFLRRQRMSRPAAAAAPPAPPATNSLQATSIVLLKNLVGPGEVDADLKIETTAECAKFGAVTDCVIYECPPNTTPPEEAVRIFVRFQDIASATRARAEMDGRFFGGRRVTASFFDEGRFQRQQWL